MRLKDKVAIVTGGGSGIGRGVCQAFAREGAHVVVVDLNLSGAQVTLADVEAAGQQGRAVQADVSDPTQVRAMVAATQAAFGRIDVLFNGAGIISPTSLLDTTVELWDQILTVNLRGQFLCLQAVAQVMAQQGRGKIINISSILAYQGRINRGAYGASKAGIISLTQTAAVELGPLGIHVNALAPGSIETPFVQSAPSSPEVTQRKLAAIPLRRRGTPEDLMGPAVFLACAESDYVTGTVLTVDGGFTASID